MFLLLVLVLSMDAVAPDYWSIREKFIEDERSCAMGANIKLTEKEEQVNHMLMKYKRHELEEGFKDPANCPVAQHFFKAKKHIEKSLVFSMLGKMPKGAMLHAHDFAMLPPTWIVKNVTYRDDLYACMKSGKWHFMFFKKPPKGDWQAVSQLRKESCSAAIFDKWLESLFTLEVEDPENTYKDINAVWGAFMDIFIVLTPLLTFRPVFEDYFYEVLQHLYNDNVMYLEMRGTLPDLYELNGDTVSGIDSIDIMVKVNQKFVENHPDHMGMKLIFAPVRRVENGTMDGYIKQFKLIKEKHPNFVAGFDLVGQEDLGKPLCDFISELRECAQGTKFFFHAGETDWFGMPTDKNLVDAVLLNSTRIGHGYAAVKHPKVMEEVKSQGIAIEVSPISNQILMLVRDIRNHPASVLLSQNFPIVISCDDPGFWGANMLSHDFYIAFMGLASCDDDLRFLKQLILNSIEYSVLEGEEKDKAMSIWEDKWESFLNDILQHEKSNGCSKDCKNYV